ncbi:MAG: hypothetical protein H6765_04070 [Candidatus Peribacteria bacterium]|nr:MAG: hypothetical protein H6765_04070 [Candidatus Peribacteria bacterium]
MQEYHDQKRDEYEDHCTENREEAMDQLKQNYDLDPLKILMGILPSIEYQLDARKGYLRGDIDL